MRTQRVSRRIGISPTRHVGVSAAVVLMLTTILLGLVASPAAAASCRTETVTTEAQLSPGEQAVGRQTVKLPSEEVTLTATEPTSSGELGPHLSVQLRWCAGAGCSPTQVLKPGRAVQVRATGVTIEQVVTLAMDAPAAAASGTVRSRVNFSSDTCDRALDAAQGGSGSGLAETGAELAAAAWGAALLAVGALLLLAGRSRRRAES